MATNYEIEITRQNVTLSEFMAYCRTRCKQKGIDFYINKKEFENPPQPMNNRYYIKGGKKICICDGYSSEWPTSEAPCQSEIIAIAPLEYQTYILNHDGSLYNEICEFTFDVGKTGHGYYYQVLKEATHAH